MITRQFLIFVVIGIINTGFSYSIYAAGIWFGLNIQEASLVSLLIGILFSFKTQGNYVFRNSDNKLILRFTLNWILIYVCMIGIIRIFSELGFNEYVSGLLALAPIAVISFFSQKTFVFNSKDQRNDAASENYNEPNSVLPLSFYIHNYRHFLRRFLVRNAHGIITYGAHSYGVPKVRWWGERVNLKIGKYCSIGKNVEIILGGNHRTDWISMYPFPAFRKWGQYNPTGDHVLSRGDVVIGNDVWLGQGCVILSGVKIGNGAVVGAYSVVTKNIPDYTIAAGNPAITIRARFSNDDISALNIIKWWNWSDEKVKTNMHKLLSKNINDFISEHSHHLSNIESVDNTLIEVSHESK